MLKLTISIRPVSVSSKKKSQVPTVRQHIAQKPSLYYVTLKVRNRAGKKTIIAPSFKGLNEGFHINSGAIMKITREFQSSEPLLLRAFDPDTHSALMINNRKSIIVKPAKFKEKVTDIVISPLSKWNIFLLQIGVKLSVFFYTVHWSISKLIGVAQRTIKTRRPISVKLFNGRLHALLLA